MFEPLNAQLYFALKRRFGTVKSGRNGEAMQCHYCVSLSADRTKKFHELVVDEGGEFYAVCCPRCHDTRHRLTFNHRWGYPDEYGNKNLHLLQCFNEGCFSDLDSRRDLHDSLYGYGPRVQYRPLRQGVRVDLSQVRATWPGVCTPLSQLPKDHPACEYLLNERFFDPKKISDIYKVRYCESSQYFLARNRLIIPLYYKGKFRGWQARHIGELDWKGPNKAELPPKYWTQPGFPKSQFLYNFDRASKHRTGVLMEGVTDVWNFGFPGMCLLGTSMNLVQTKMLIRAFGERSLVLLLDGDAYEKALPRQKELQRKFKWGVAAVRLPQDKDPADVDRRMLREWICAEADKQDVRVDFRKV